MRSKGPTYQGDRHQHISTTSQDKPIERKRQEMYEEVQFFDPQDPNETAGIAEAIGCPQTITNCSALPLVMGGGGRRGSSSHSQDSMEGKLKLSRFSLDDLSNHYNHSDYGAAAASMGFDLQQPLGFDLEHECDTQLMLEMLHDPNPTPPASPIDQPSWDATGVQEMQDMNYNLQLQRPQQTGLQQNLQTFDTTSFAIPDLLDLINLPRCSVSSMLPNPASLDTFSELPAATDTNNPSSSSIFFDNPPLHLDLPPQPPFFRKVHSLPHNYGLHGSRGCGSVFDGINEREGSSGGCYQDGDGRQIENSVLDLRRVITGLGKGVDGRGTHHYGTEKKRREQFNEKYKTLGALVPNPSKRDKASVVGDAIEYIKELLRTVQELKLLIDKKKCMQERNKRLKLDDETAVDMGSSSMKSCSSALTDHDQSFNGSLRSSWSQRRSKETEVDVRIIDDEVTIKLKQRKKMNCLLLVSKVIDELQLELLHVAGGKIADFDCFLFNTKICEGSSVNANAMAKKLIEVVDR